MLVYHDALSRSQRCSMPNGTFTKF